MPLSELDGLLECYFRLWTDRYTKDYRIGYATAIWSLRDHVSNLLGHQGLCSITSKDEHFVTTPWVDVPNTNFQEGSNKCYLRRKPKND